MKRALLLVTVVGCVPDSDPPWQLDHDRIVAVRAEPPALLPGEVGHLEILRAHVGGPTTVESPTLASAPGPLFTAVHFNVTAWQIDGPDDTQLASARTELGLPDGAPVPLDVELRVGQPGVDALYATKRVLLGATAENPVLPGVTIGGAAAGAEITTAGHRELPLLIEATDARWFTSCGELRENTTLLVGGTCRGELAVVVRDGVGGVVWQVWPMAVD